MSHYETNFLQIEFMVENFEIAWNFERFKANRLANNDCYGRGKSSFVNDCKVTNEQWLGIRVNDGEMCSVFLT